MADRHQRRETRHDRQRVTGPSKSPEVPGVCRPAKRGPELDSVLCCWSQETDAGKRPRYNNGKGSLAAGGASHWSRHSTWAHNSAKCPFQFSRAAWSSEHVFEAEATATIHAAPCPFGARGLEFGGESIVTACHSQAMTRVSIAIYLSVIAFC